MFIFFGIFYNFFHDAKSIFVLRQLAEVLKNNFEDLRFDLLWTTFKDIGDHVVAWVTQAKFQDIIILD